MTERRAVGGPGVSIVRVGSWETGFDENDDNVRPWPLPNIIGARRRAGEP